jgi:hypothetical protein
MPATPTGKYYDALATFNDTVESYLWHYEVMDVEKQALLREYVHPIIHEASIALDYWGQAKDDTTRMQVYNAVFKRFQMLIIKYGVGGAV